jgi:hypothetical protein
MKKREILQCQIPLIVSGVFLVTSPIIYIFLSFANAGLVYLFVKTVLQKSDSAPEFDIVSIYGNLILSVISVAVYFFMNKRFGKIIMSFISAFFISSYIMFLFLNVFKHEIGFYFMPYVIGAILTAILLSGIEVVKLYMALRRK